jgi:protein-L-isoaspartate(D-aspartate) O-methyltransferase
MVALLTLGIVEFAVEPMTALAQSDPFAALRTQMVEKQIRARGIEEPSVVRAMGEVPRHRFIPPSEREWSYADSPVRIGSGQTISQPYIVALMTSLLDLDGDEKILEIGTGSGYQAGVLSRLVDEVYTIEIRKTLADEAEQILSDLGYTNVHVIVGDGYRGLPDEQPFDGIIVTAAAERIPQPLIDQLKEGGKLVIPVGDYLQDLIVLTKTADGVERQTVSPVRFVRMIGEVEEQQD